MRIPSGDLAPVRRRRRSRRPYGQRRPYGRRRRSPLPIVLGVLLVLLISGGAYLLQREDDGAGEVTQASRCPSAAPSPRAPLAARSVAPVVLPVAGQVQLRLLNGTGRNGLARTVGNELARRGFRLVGTGNAPKQLAGATRISFGPGARPAAMLVAAHIIGAQLVPVPAAPRGSVDATLGSSFVRLRTGAEVTAYVRALAHPTTPVPKPKPAGPPGCR